MKKEHVYIAVAIFLALFLIVVSFDDGANLIGRVVDENSTNETTTTNETETTNQTTETNQTINQTSDNQTTTTNETETTNQTTETNQTNTTTQDDSSQTTSTTTTTVEDESDVQVQVNATESSVDSGLNVTLESQESEVDRILRELEEQGVLEGSQPKQPIEQQEEAPTLTGSAIEESNETTCEGCLLKEECYAFNERRRGDYCLENKSWSPQIAFNVICTENFECRSNSCVDGQCTQVNILQVFIDWLRNLFNFEFSGDNNITNASN